MKAKQLVRALNDLAEEGVTQVFQPDERRQWIVGVVGPLQLEVLLDQGRGSATRYSSPSRRGTSPISRKATPSLAFSATKER
jgi:hypothetical protein